MANKGEIKFKLKGDYFKQLGEEYSYQNPIYTTRTFPENILNLDGTNAYSRWTGGIIGVTEKQIEVKIRKTGEVLSLPLDGDYVQSVKEVLLKL